MSEREGPLAGMTGVELAGIGPAPFACMLLADLGADIVRVDRTVAQSAAYTVPTRYELLNRGRTTIAVDLKQPGGVEAVARLADRADFFVEGFRPGVAERLGLGPEVLAARNPGLVYGRMTGWGQAGPMAQVAGHDLNYLGLSGVLNAIGPADQPPPPPLNVVGDFGGGGLLLAFGIVSALVERARSGRGQTIDAAIVDGVSLLATFMYGARGAGQWAAARQSNLVDGGAHVYSTYATSDGRFVAVASIEEKFYQNLCATLGLDRADMPDPDDRDRWPQLRKRLAAVFATRTRDEWTATFTGVDACVTPVLTVDEALAHPHLVARESFVDVDGVVQPASAPRFSRTPGMVRATTDPTDHETDTVLGRAGYTEAEIDHLRTSGAIR